MRIARVLKALSYYLAIVVILAGFADFAWVLGANNKYGGGALNGYVRDGHYFLGLHGDYTEVSRAIWEDIHAHEVALFLGWPLVLGCMFYLLVAGVLPWMAGLRRGEAVAARVRTVRSSGPLLARARCGGNVTGMSLGFPVIALELYPAGLTVRVALEPVVAILREELTRVDVPKGRFGRRVELTYRSPDIQSPLALGLSRTNELVVALRRFTEPTET
jgi:hypothetical protein